MLYDKEINRKSFNYTTFYVKAKRQSFSIGVQDVSRNFKNIEHLNKFSYMENMVYIVRIIENNGNFPMFKKLNGHLEKNFENTAYPLKKIENITSFLKRKHRK